MISKATLTQLSEIYSKSNLENGIFLLVKKFYLKQFFQIQQDPVLQGILERMRSKKPLNKTDTILLSFSVFENETIYKGFLATLPLSLQTLIEKLLWVESMTDGEVEKLLNETITVPSRYSYPDDKELKNEYYFFSVKKQSIYTFSGTYIITLSIHPLFKQILMEFYPKPIHYYFIQLDEIPETTYRFTTENLIMEEMPRLLSYYMQGGIKYSINGKPAESTLNKLQRTCGITEFVTGADESLGKIRSMLLAGMMYNFKVSNISIDTVSVLKDLFTKQYIKLYTSQFLLMQLKGWGYMGDFDYNESAEHNLLEVLKQLPLEKWVSAENLINFIECRFIQVKPVNTWAINNRLYFESNVGSHTSYKEKKYAGSKANMLVNHPFIKGTVFLLASFGLMEIGYTGVDTAEYAKTYYSGYDGLQYFRLTALGAYVLGLSDVYEPALAQQQNKLQFSEDSLMMLAEGDMGVLDVMLGNFAEKAGNNRFKVSPAHFLKDCRNKKDIDNKIALFKRTVSAKLPAYWEQQFVTLKANALKIDPDLHTKVFKIPPADKELQRLIAQDSVLKALVLKAEQFYILVPAGNGTKFKSRMKELGYFVE